jgi:hypothetical protein
MVLLIATVLGIFVAWRVRVLGLYVALCDGLGVALSGVAALVYSGDVAAVVPVAHPLKGSACMLAVFVIGWLMFRSAARSFSGEWAIEFGKPIDMFGSMAVAFGGTMMFVGVVSTIILTTGELLDKIAFMTQSLEQTAGIAISACRFVAYFAGGNGQVSLEVVIHLATAA